MRQVKQKPCTNKVEYMFFPYLMGSLFVYSLETVPERLSVSDSCALKLSKY
jgi:hypothetical protein